MKVLMDTSALFAVLDKDDLNHGRAAKAWENLLLSDDCALITTNYVLVECAALVAHRLGMDAARIFHQEMVSPVDILWIDAEIHQAAVSAFLAASRRGYSLVDCATFEVMRRRGIERVFTFDRHFREQGFSCVP